MSELINHMMIGSENVTPEMRELATKLDDVRITSGVGSTQWWNMVKDLEIKPDLDPVKSASDGWAAGCACLDDGNAYVQFRVNGNLFCSWVSWGFAGCVIGACLGDSECHTDVALGVIAAVQLAD